MYIQGEITNEFWRVYNYLALHWYEQEYGAVIHCDRWYEPSMLLLEGMLPGRKVS